MDTYKIYYNDGVWAATISFPADLAEEEKQVALNKEIEAFNQNPNTAWHITQTNIVHIQ